MAPKRGMSVEHTEEYEEFMKKLTEYHEKRGTTLEAEPKVGVRHIDLLKLYHRVVEEGGYDLVSDTKAKPLMWRRFAEEFVGKNQYTAAQAFQIKNVYYKNLCAYEISEHWKKEPPPKEILEDITAKGANVMGRTLENFQRPPTKEERNLEMDDSETSPEQKTPKAEVTTDGAEDPGSATGRTTRGLRQAPPQRVLFQPDLAPGRQTRGAVPASSSPAPNGMMGTSMMNGSAPSTLANYEPSQSYPLSLKPVVTPANNPDHYRSQLKRKAEAAAGPLAKKYKNIMLPGTGFIGPNIYVRAQLALQSGIPEEEQYALHHLVKISHERGDKYRFDQFPGLAEALVKKALQVCGLFYDVDWDVSYDDETMDADDETMNGLTGTSDILQRLRSRIPRVTDDSISDARFLSQLNRIMEAGLVVRNMCLQRENAQYLCNMPIVRDYLAVVLNLPQHPGVIELQHYALDTAEQLVVWCDLGAKDALYQALLEQLYGQDRGAIIMALRTISRIAMNLAGPKRLDDVPAEILRKVQAWLLVEDEELRSAGLDFLFQYTSFADNVDNLLRIMDAEVLAHQLSRLLLYGVKEERQIKQEKEEKEDKSPQPVPRMSRSIVEQLLKLEEPERSAEWLRMCFVSDRESEMTQISLWQAYQSTFAPFGATHPHMIAGEFIKQVSTTFAGASAQVAGRNRYVIRGIRARKVPVDTGMLPNSKAGDKGKELHKCSWQITVPAEPQRDPITGVMSGAATREVGCADWFKDGDKMLEHILRDHLQLPRKPPTPKEADVDKMEVDSKPTSRPASALGMTNGHTNGTPVPPAKSVGDLFDFAAAEKATFRCRWAGCRRTTLDFPSGGEVPRTALFARHIQTHLPDTTHADRAKHNLKPDATRSSLSGEKVILQGLMDEKNDAFGVSLNAALVLRNIAKFMPVDSSTASSGGSGPNGAKEGLVNGGGAAVVKVEQEDGGGLMARVFDEEVVERLFYALTHCRPIHNYVGSVLRAIGRSGT